MDLRLLSRYPIISNLTGHLWDHHKKFVLLFAESPEISPALGFAILGGQEDRSISPSNLLFDPSPTVLVLYILYI